jgi:hypothetical protein
MKTMTCKQLGGACDREFHAETFDEMASLSKKHGGDMFKKKDEAHMKAMQEMMARMNEPGAMETWMEEKRQIFIALSKDAP